MQYTIPNQWLMERTGRHRSTILRWRAADRLPPELDALAALELGGEIGRIHSKWDGWTLHPRSGELVTPGGDAYTAAEIHLIPLYTQRIDALEHELGLRRRRPRSIVKRIAAWFVTRADARRRRRRPHPLSPDYAASLGPAIGRPRRSGD